MIRPATLGLLTAFALAVPAAVSAAPQRPVAAATHVSPAPTGPVTATAADASGYAQRERKDKQVASYEGGSFIVIGISGGALVILLLFLLLI